MTLLWSRKTHILAWACLVLVLLPARRVWCQAEANTQTASGSSSEAAQLQVPPPVSGQGYSTAFVGQDESNYLRGGISLSGAYSNDVSGGSTPVGSSSFSIWPTIMLDRTTYRSTLQLNYSPGFTFYQNASALNQSNQNLGFHLQYRLSPYVTATFQESFSRTPNIFNQPNPASTTSVSGSVPAPGVAVIVPAANQTNNATSAGVTYQISENGMVGVSGNFSKLGYSNQAQAAGVFDSQSVGASAFYSTRVHERYYAGISYQYGNMLSYQSVSPSTRTQTQTIFMFVTVYVKPTFSFSVSAGPQHYISTQAPFPTAAAWQPMTMLSVSWQGERTTVAASYARSVNNGGGLNGTFHSNIANLSLMWRANRDWTTGVSGSYGNYNNLTPEFLGSSQGGHTISGTVFLQRAIKENVSLQFGYSWAHQTYAGIAIASNTPNISRAFVTLTFHFDRPLQR
jgi:hypothetical protein